jgi:hypothetical protein
MKTDVAKIVCGSHIVHSFIQITEIRFQQKVKHGGKILFILSRLQTACY